MQDPYRSSVLHDTGCGTTEQFCLQPCLELRATWGLAAQAGAAEIGLAAGAPIVTAQNRPHPKRGALICCPKRNIDFALGLHLQGGGYIRPPVLLYLQSFNDILSKVTIVSKHVGAVWTLSLTHSKCQKFPNYRTFTAVLSYIQGV